jgi:DNA-binding NarL/FixJ family response regulator
MLRIILADDHTILRDGLCAILSGHEDIKIVGEAPNGNVLVGLLETTPVDLVLMDINLPVMNGLETMQHINEHHKHIKILVLTGTADPGLLQQVMNTGAKGYILKKAGKNDLMYAIKQIAEDKTYISPELLSTQRSNQDKVKFTKRELQILQLIAEGMTNKEIADKIFLSKRTVETHRKNLIEKTKSKNTSVLIRYAITNGLL